MVTKMKRRNMTSWTWLEMCRQVKASGNLMRGCLFGSGGTSHLSRLRNE